MVDRRCVSVTQLWELVHGIPWTTAFEEVHAGMNAEQIQCVLRALLTLHVIPLNKVLDECKLWALDPYRPIAQEDFVTRKLRPEHECQELITVYTPLFWPKLKHLRRQKYQLLVCYHQV